MKRLTLFAIRTAAVLAISAAPALAAPPSGLREEGGRTFSTSTLLVKVRSNEARGAALRAAGVTAARTIPDVGSLDPGGAIGLARWYTCTVAPGDDVRAVVARLEAREDVESACLNLMYEEFVVPDDPEYDANWGHHNTAQLPLYGSACPPGCGSEFSHCLEPVGTVGFDTDMDSAWDGSQAFGDSSVVIAIIDSGFDLNHPDLRFGPGRDFEDGDDLPFPSGANGHGTACAGVAAAIVNNGLGVAGVAGGCTIMPLRALLAGKFAHAITWAANHGADILSTSVGYPGTVSYPPIDDALTAAAGAGVLILAAAGNAGIDPLWLPANHPDVLAIGAADPCGGRKTPASCDGEAYWGSAYGVDVQDAPDAIALLGPTFLPTTDLVGPTGYSDGDYCPSFGGTSCATPYVAGVAALIRSVDPSLGPSGIRQILTSTATDIVNAESGVGWDRYTGYGLVNAAAAVGVAAVDAPVPAPGRGISLLAFPNPAREAVRIAYSVATPRALRITVHDVAGRKVRTLLDATARDGVLAWDGRDESGVQAAAGVYFVRLAFEGQARNRRVLLIR